MWQRAFCPNCGYRLCAGDRFCGNCGVNLAMAAAAQADPDVFEMIQRKIEGYRKLYPERDHKEPAQTEQLNNKEAPVSQTTRTEIIKLLSSLISK